MSHLVGLTPQEIADLDAADGVQDGKIHGIDASKFVHDKSKSTKEGEWELRDGKYYRRDYYASTVERSPAPSPPRVVPPPARLPPIVQHDDRDRIIAELRREIEELRRLLHDRDSLIGELRLRISHLEIQISQVNVRVDTGNSYYVVRSQRGADLLRDYGKSSGEILINPLSAPPPVAAVLPAAPVFPPVTLIPSVSSPLFLGTGFEYSSSYVAGQVYTPVERSTTTFIAPQVSVAAHTSHLQTNVHHSTSIHAQSSSKTNEYYRVENEEMRRKLDLMDGVEDGRLNGAEIRVNHQIGGGYGGAITSGAHTTAARVSGQEYYRVGDEAMRRKLDLMDGVEDGKLNGADIRVGALAGGASSHSHTSTRMIAGGAGGRSVSGKEYYRVNDEAMKHKLDMMDGVQDGKLRGADIRVSGRF